MRNIVSKQLILKTKYDARDESHANCTGNGVVFAWLF